MRSLLLALVLCAGCKVDTKVDHFARDMAFGAHSRIDDLERRVELLIRLQGGCRASQ